MFDIIDTYELQEFVTNQCEDLADQYIGLLSGILDGDLVVAALADLYAAAEQLPDGDRRDDVMSDLATICDHYGIEQDQLP